MVRPLFAAEKRGKRLAITRQELLTLRLVYRLNRWRWTWGTVSSAELRYQAIFDAAVARSGIAVPPLYTLGPAANASLLYLLFRLVGDFPELDILELGAGQSTLLLDALNRAGRARSVLTLEHDPAWSQSVAGRVGHEVRLAPLRDEVVLGVATQTYAVSLAARYSCVIVDAPPGAPRHSRWGSLQLLQQNLAAEFVVIFDDAERPGERDTVNKFLELHPEAGHVFLHAAKSQCVVFTKGFAGVRSYSDR
jgi:hypothetical protein